MSFGSRCGGGVTPAWTGEADTCRRPYGAPLRLLAELKMIDRCVENRGQRSGHSTD